MSTNHTTNYELCQWEATDQVQRTDFNQDNAKIDAALADLAARQLRICSGQYFGTGAFAVTLELPFPPIFLWVQNVNENTNRLVKMGEHSMACAKVDGIVYAYNEGNRFDITVTGNTVEISGKSTATEVERPQLAMNRKSNSYIYIAVG